MKATLIVLGVLLLAGFIGVQFYSQQPRWKIVSTQSPDVKLGTVYMVPMHLDFPKKLRVSFACERDCAIYWINLKDHEAIQKNPNDAGHFQRMQSQRIFTGSLSMGEDVSLPPGDFFFYFIPQRKGEEVASGSVKVNFQISAFE